MLYLLDKKNSHIQGTQCDFCVKKNNFFFDKIVSEQ